MISECKGCKKSFILSVLNKKRDNFITIYVILAFYGIEIEENYVILQRSTEQIDIIGSDIPNHHLRKDEPTPERASAHIAQAFQRLEWLVVSRECVEMACAFQLDKI
jgi:hypothetical protein